MKKRTSKKGDCGELKYVTLSCSRLGIPQSTASNVLKPYTSIKCNCMAQLMADSRSRVAYEEFGDAITFDTTYLTNKYDMPFAPFVSVYTIAKFKEFQDKLTGKMNCEVVDTKKDGAFLKYQISEDMILRTLCRHAIYVLIKHKIDLIAEKYILRKWGKDVTRRHTKIKISNNESNATLVAHQCDKMQKTFDEIKELATDSEERCVIVMAWMQKLKEQLSNHNNVCGGTQPTPKSPTSRNFDNCVNEISNSKKILTPLAQLAQ
ncbi:unnamed protein product [Prunus brigantina]